MVINSRRETQILTVGPDQLWPARERGGGGVMPSCTDSTLHSPGAFPLCTAVPGQAGSRPTVHWLLALPLAPQPSQWQSGPGHNNTESGPQWAASLRTCYEHSLENFGLDKWQPCLGPPGVSCQLNVDLHHGDCQGKRIVFSFCSRWLDKTLWKCSSQWIMFYITCTLTGLSKVKLVTCCCFSLKCTSTEESFRGKNVIVCAVSVLLQCSNVSW